MTSMSYADVTALPPEWTWQWWLPVGQVVLLGGDSGIGKGYLIADTAARITRGIPFIDGSPSPAPGHVIIVGPEDDPQYSTVHRLKAAGAEMSRVHDFTYPRPPTDPDHDLEFQLPEDADLLDAEIKRIEKETKEKVRLVVLDPLGAISSVSLRAPRQVSRSIMRPMMRIANFTDTTILVVNHVNKRPGKKGRIDKDEIAGAKDLTNRARHVIGVTLDDTGQYRTVEVIKSNLAQAGVKKFVYTITGDWPTTHVEIANVAVDAITHKPQIRDILLEYVTKHPYRDVAAIADGTKLPPRSVRNGLTELVNDDVITRVERGVTVKYTVKDLAAKRKRN